MKRGCFCARFICTTKSSTPNNAVCKTGTHWNCVLLNFIRASELIVKEIRTEKSAYTAVASKNYIFIKILEKPLNIVFTLGEHPEISFKKLQNNKCHAKKLGQKRFSDLFSLFIFFYSRLTVPFCNVKLSNGKFYFAMRFWALFFGAE